MWTLPVLPKIEVGSIVYDPRNGKWGKVVTDAAQVLTLEAIYGDQHLVRWAMAKEFMVQDPVSESFPTEEEKIREVCPYTSRPFERSSA